MATNNKVVASIGADFGNINVKIANRILLKLFPDRLVADIGQPADAVPLQTPMQT
jgi:hypothetical protein